MIIRFRKTDMVDRQTERRTLHAAGERGFTLIELLVAMVVAAVLVAFAAPNMRAYIQNNRVIAQANGLVVDLQYARGQAVATHGYVSICPLASAGGSSCDTSDGSYANGWMVFTTTAPSTDYSSTTGAQLRVQAAPTTTTVTASSKGILTYDSFGQLWATGKVSGTSIAVCSNTGSGSGAKLGSQLTISPSGRGVSTPLQSSVCS